MLKVYLAGYISGKKIKECRRWREYLKWYYFKKAWNKILWLDPFNGQKDNTIDKEGLTSSIDYKTLFYRDYNGVVNSDLMIANLDTFGEDRPVIGTLFEMGWAWDKKIPIITIANKQWHIQHPFIRVTSTQIVDSVDEIIDEGIIDFYYRSKVNSIPVRIDNIRKED